MRKLILLAGACLFVWSGLGRSADAPAKPVIDPTDGNIAKQLLDVATNSKLSPLVRAAALDALGTLGARAKDVVGGLAVLVSADPKQPERDFIVFHAAGALGGIGYDARTAVPPLLGAKGSNYALNQAIDRAVQTILLAPAPPPATQTLSGPVKALIDNLSNTNLKVSDRLAAAENLGRLDKPSATDLDAALKGLFDVMKDGKNPTPTELRLVAAESATALVAASDKTDKNYTQRARDYTEALAAMLDAGRPPMERVFAAKRLGEFKGEIPNVPLPLLKATTADGDADVRSAALSAINKVKGDDKPLTAPGK